VLSIRLELSAIVRIEYFKNQSNEYESTIWNDQFEERRISTIMIISMRI